MSRFTRRIGRERRGVARSCCVMVVASIVLAAAQASADTTVWTNADGGAWGDAANWSNGVPTAADEAWMPELDADGYSIQVGVAGCNTVWITGSNVELCGGTLSLTSVLKVGDGARSGKLILNGLAVAVGECRVGRSAGIGHLILRDGATLSGGNVLVGDASTGGVGTWEIRTRSSVNVANVLLAPTSVTTIDCNQLLLAAVDCVNIQRGGTLVVEPEPGFVLPCSAYAIVHALTPSGGSFAAVVPPVVEGYQGTVTVESQLVMVGPLDPIIAIEVTPDALRWPLFAGFATNYTLNAVSMSGYPVPSPVYQLTAADGTAMVSNGSVTPFAPGPLTLTASVSASTGSFTTTVRETVQAMPLLEYQRLDVPEWGQPSGEGGLPHFYERPNMSSDGRYVAFATSSSTLLPPDPQPQLTNVFVKDRWTGAVEQADAGGVVGSQNGAGSGPTISGDGRYVVFLKSNGGVRSVWVRDRWAGETWKASVGPNGESNNKSCDAAIISQDGSTVLLLTLSTNLVPGVPAGLSLLYRYDMRTRTNSIVMGADGQIPNGSCGIANLTPDGRYIAFSTGATNFVPENEGDSRLVLLDTATGQFERVDVGEAGPGTGVSHSPSLSADGRFVAYSSTADNLGAPPDGERGDIFLRDRVAGTTTWMSPDVLGPGLSNDFGFPAISGNGEIVAFALGGAAPVGQYSLLEVATNARPIVPTFLLTDPWGNHSGSYWGPWLSYDGKTVLSTGNAQMLVPYELNVQGLIIRHAPSPPEDITRDGYVNGADLALLLASWADQGSPADLDRDGTVGAGDLAILLAAWSV